MDRPIAYVGQSIYEWSLSKPAQNEMVAISKLAAALFGTNGLVNGLACTQTSVPSMQVSIGAGELYQLSNLESTVCGTLPADTTNQILKQGILLGSAAPYNIPASSTFAAPSTVGQSINYLIEAQYVDQDVSIDPTTGSTPVVLQFYDAANPSLPWSGANNLGASSNTFRKGVIQWAIKAGAAATTGTQTTPSVDSGYIGLYVVTVAYGAASITNSNISVYPGAPILPSNGIVSGGFQNNVFNAAIAGGTADALTAVFNPAPTNLAIGVPDFTIRVSTANLTTTPTFTPNSGVIPAYVIVKGNNLPLAPGDLAGAGHWATLQWDATLSKWVLLNPATGVSSQRAQIQPISASVASNALTVGLSPTNMDFRSNSLTSGAVNTRTVGSAISLVVPSGATLGSVASTSSRLAVLAIDNAGTIELAITNLSGGLNLDETTLISTTAISAAATANNVIYSNTARSNVPFRVVGFIDITETTPGTWVTAPTTIQGQGGQAMAAMSSLGYGQTIQNVAPSRTFSTTYYNTTGKPITVIASMYGSTISATIYATVNGVSFYGTACGQVANASAVTFVVPPGGSYSAVMNSGTSTIATWVELR